MTLHSAVLLLCHPAAVCVSNAVMLLFAVSCLRPPARPDGWLIFIFSSVINGSTFSSSGFMTSTLLVVMITCTGTRARQHRKMKRTGAGQRCASIARMHNPLLPGTSTHTSCGGEAVLVLTQAFL
jgi:hypothetical protein